jgi:ATP-dependent DNA helicase RecQ
VANESFDLFIKLLLRSYTGMFSEFVAINEEAMARKSAATRDTIYHYLVKLSALNIIRYIPGKKSALVIFTEERLERKALLISPENYLHVREKYEIRLNKMIDYAESENRCRSATILEYFGEESDRCGICDVCRKRNELDLSKYEFDVILEEIKSVLAQENPDAEELVKRVDYAEDKVIKVIRWLLDHNKMSQDKDHKLTWKT